MWTRCFSASCVALMALAPAAAVRADDHAPRWNAQWPRVQWWEAAAMTALAAEAFTVRFGLEWKESESFAGDNFVDDWALEDLRVHDLGAYRGWIAAGDMTYYASMAWSAVDPLSVGMLHGSWDVAGQMMLMNMEAYAFYSAALWTTQLFVRRERPQTDLCDRPQVAADRNVDCDGPDRFRSFIGGHVGVVTMSAALTCLHHSEMELYGQSGDVVACGALTAMAGVTFASRTVTAKHHLTDNVLGAGLGLLSGGLLPWALHYGQERFDLKDLDEGDEVDEEDDRHHETPRLVGVSLRPNLADRGLQLHLLGVL